MGQLFLWLIKHKAMKTVSISKSTQVFVETLLKTRPTLAVGCFDSLVFNHSNLSAINEHWNQWRNLSRNGPERHLYGLVFSFLYDAVLHTGNTIIFHVQRQRLFFFQRTVLSGHPRFNDAKLKANLLRIQYYKNLIFLYSSFSGPKKDFAVQVPANEINVSLPICSWMKYELPYHRQ